MSENIMILEGFPLVDNSLKIAEKKHKLSYLSIKHSLSFYIL